MATVSKSIAITSEGIYNVELEAYTTINVTLYSAANDVVSFTDESGSKTCATDVSGIGTTSIQIMTGTSKDITFTSSVAKSTELNSSTPYSKTITITESTTDVRVMPDKTIYWYGYLNGTVDSTNQGLASANKVYPGITRNTNTITAYVSNSSSSQEGSIRFYNIAGFTSGKFCIRLQNTNCSSQYAQWRVLLRNTSASIGSDSNTFIGRGADKGAIDLRDATTRSSDPYVIWIWLLNTMWLNISAIWLQD